MVSRRFEVDTESGTYYIKLVSVSLLIRKGKNFIVRSTRDEKLVDTSEWNADRSTFGGSARLVTVCTPAFRNTQSRSG